MTKVSRAQCPILSRNSTILMQQMLTRHSMALCRKNSRRRTGSPMTQFHTTSQPYKRRCIPSVSSANESEVRVAKSNFYLTMRHFSRPNYGGQEAGWLNVGNVLMFRCESLLLIYKSLLLFHWHDWMKFLAEMSKILQWYAFLQVHRVSCLSFDSFPYAWIWWTNFVESFS